MKTTIDLADVPPVSAAELSIPMRIALDLGHGLALYKGLTEAQVRAIETALWNELEDSPETRLAVSLRFRALLDVFAAQRLKELFLVTGFKLVAKALEEAASQRLNVNYGFSPQRFVMALETMRPANVTPYKVAVRERVAA